MLHVNPTESVPAAGIQKGGNRSRNDQAFYADICGYIKIRGKPAVTRRMLMPQQTTKPIHRNGESEGNDPNPEPGTRFLRMIDGVQSGNHRTHAAGGKPERQAAQLPHGLDLWLYCEFGRCHKNSLEEFRHFIAQARETRPFTEI